MTYIKTIQLQGFRTHEARRAGRCYGCGTPGADASPVATARTGTGRQPRRQPRSHDGSPAPIVRARRTNQRTDERKPIRCRRKFREQLTNLKTRQLGLNRLELTTNLPRSVWFHVDRVQLRRTAVQMDVDDGLA